MDAQILRKLNSGILLAGGAFIVIYIMRGTKPHFEEGFSLLLVWGWLFPLVIISALTFSPFYVFHRMSCKVHKITKKPSLHYICISLSIIVLLVSLKLYYEASVSIKGSTSSTASLIYAVLPFYILIGGSIFYGVLIMGAKNNA